MIKFLHVSGSVHGHPHRIRVVALNENADPVTIVEKPGMLVLRRNENGEFVLSEQSFESLGVDLIRRATKN